MRLLGCISVLLALSMTQADAAVAQRGARSGSGTTSTTQASNTRTNTQKTNSGAQTSQKSAPTGTGTSSARAATRGRVVTPNQPSTNKTTGTPKVDGARAATKQKVVNAGTKIEGATANTVVNEECQTKYYGCMDSFCMLDNTSGGRCTCSDKNAEFDAILAQIQELDAQSYKMATVGVERIEMGADADAAMKIANDAATAALTDSTSDKNTKKTSRRTIDTSAWNNSNLFDDSDTADMFGTNETDPLANKTGDALYSAASKICAQQIPECSANMTMLQMTYSRKIASDCNAYKNSLDQQKQASQTKLATAQKALRDAALEQYQSANKYDLGQCTIQFKNCMVKTAGCGEDFSGCAAMSALDNTSAGAKSTSKKTKNYFIKGSATTIEISSSTYDTLMAKKPLCESVTKQCVAVKDNVWDTFLREVAPQLKSAEIIAEDNARQNCVGNISSCFQKACKDTIDPNDPDGSYDMCLSRPETMLNVCKIPLEKCNISTTSAKEAEKSNIWDYVVARLAAMRVDACTKEVKECLQSTDRCGEDYSQCIGLDTDTIIRMCPYDKLVGCQKKYDGKETDMDTALSNLVQGIMLNIDNSLLTQCQNAANEAMIKVCGDTENCNNLTVTQNIGSRSLDYKICALDNSGQISSSCYTSVDQIPDSSLGLGTESITPLSAVIEGVMYWDNIKYDSEKETITTVEEYVKAITSDSTELKKMSDKQKEKIAEELGTLQASIDAAIKTIEADTTVQFCMTGREVQGMKISSKNSGQNSNSQRQKLGEKDGDAARFPKLTTQMRMIIANAAIKVAKDNYYKKYDEINDKALTDYTKISERIAKNQKENSLAARRESARLACVNFADLSSIPQSAEPPKPIAGRILAAVAITAAVVAIPLTGGLSATVAGSSIALKTGVLSVTATASTASLSTGAVIAGGAAALATGGVISDAVTGRKANGDSSNAQLDLVGSKSINQWNYKQTITSTFSTETLSCHICTTSQNCQKTGGWATKKYCKIWADETESCKDVNF